MKTLGIVSASLVIVGSLGVSAAAVLKPNVFKFATDDTVASEDCTAKSGTVSTAPDGNKVCTLPKGANSLKFAATDTVAASDCTTKGGAVTTAEDGNQVCTKGAITTAPAPAPAREPSN